MTENHEMQVKRAKSIIDHMRIFGRKPGAEPAWLDARKVIETSMGQIGAQLRQDAIDVTINGPEQCRPVLGYQDQLEQVILNLLGNARDALSDNAKARNRIMIELKENAETVEFSIEDTGGGISEKDLSRIFEPFYTARETGSGTGLGLSISYGIIKDMGGSIAAENTGSGVRFTVSLPHHRQPEV